MMSIVRLVGSSGPTLAMTAYMGPLSLSLDLAKMSPMSARRAPGVEDKQLGQEYPSTYGNNLKAQ